MIGGVDHVFRVSRAAPVFDLARRVVRRAWPGLVAERAEDGVLVLYRDRAARDAVALRGVADDLQDALLQVYPPRDDGPHLRRVTVVAGPGSGLLVASLRSALQADLLWADRKESPGGTRVPEETHDA